jgi:type IV secretion system protein VirB9
LKTVLFFASAAMVFATAALPPAKALDIPRGAGQDSRVRFVNYQPYDITRIVGTLRSSVQVEFSADEEIAHVALGNSVAWEVAPAGNILFLKPRENQPITNISVVTARRDGSKRSYQMELTVRDGSVASGENTYFYVKYRYPGDEAVRRRLEAQARDRAAKTGAANTVLAIHEQYGPRNWRYSVQGAAALEPDAVYDNGKVTTFSFATVQEMPAIYLENSDGTESLVAKSVSGQLVLVHAVSRKFILRRGEEVLCVFNEADNLGSANPDTHTTSPSVERIVRTSAELPPELPAQGARQ